MKKYLNKNLFKVHIAFFVAVFGIILFSPNSLAQTKLDYYKNLFGSKFGFTVYEENKDISSKKYYLSSDLSESHLILLSSDILGGEGLDKYLEKNGKIILICDKPYTAEGKLSFTCDKSTVYSNQLENTGGFLKTSNSQNVDLYIIPENLLASPDKRSDVENYLKAFRRSDVVPLVSEDTKLDSWVGQREKDVKSLLKTTTFETFGIALSIIMILSLFFGLLRFLSSENKKKFDLSVLKNILIRINDYFVSSRLVTVYSLILIVLIYIPIIITLGVKDGKGVSVGYYIIYSLDTFKITNLIDYINQGDYFRIVILFYNYIFLTTLTILFIPFLVNTLFVASSKIGKAKLKSRIHKYLAPSMIILAIIAVSFFGITECYRFLIFAVVVLVFLNINNLRYKTFDYTYSSRDKMIFASAALFMVTAGFLMKIREKEIGPIYQQEDLIGVTDSIVTLPYSKQMGRNVLFNDFSLALSVPVFADQYLVYSPTNARVENKNISEFKNSGSFYIQNGKIEDMLSVIYASKELSEALISKSPSNLLRIKSFENRFEEKAAKIQITFSCERESFGINEIKPNFYYLSKGGEVKKSEETLLYFPGCSKVREPETFTVEFKPPHVESESFFMELAGVLDSDVGAVKIITSDVVIESIYYSKGVGCSVIASSGRVDSSSAKITNYIFGNSYDLSFDMNFDSDGKFNISQPINKLVKEGRLKDSFLIWSLKKYVPIKSD